ncbi:MAG: DUF3293 domain-containing protein [Zoogloeaceae bacterium]|jgi:hypothetical protein|nr:DUF3293 domain-containing protein [Zoogloeaceae bacterium]
MSSALERAYRATAYRVWPGAGMEWVLRVGAPAPRALDTWLAAEKHTCWSLLTACNPESRRLSIAENRARQAALRRALTRLRWRFLPGENRADAANWPPEATFWIPGMKAATAGHLARAFGQNAFLWGAPGRKTQLLWTNGAARDMRARRVHAVEPVSRATRAMASRQRHYAFWRSHSARAATVGMQASGESARNSCSGCAP